MKKYAISDLQGNGKIYHSIMSYLENKASEEKIELIICGDLIGRGKDSFEILKDVKERIEGKGNILIHYLGGDQELMMYQALLIRQKGERVNPCTDWIKQGGKTLEEGIIRKKNREEEYEKLKLFIGNLKIYHTLEESIYQRPILLVHAQAPKKVKRTNQMAIKENNAEVYNCLYRRLDELDRTFFLRGNKGIMYHNKMGDQQYFLIKGHTRIQNKDGFFYHPTEHYIDIAGTYHTPLIEIEENKLTILTFNNKNQIVTGSILKGSKLYKMDWKLFEENQNFLKKENLNEERSKEKVFWK